MNERTNVEYTCRMEVLDDAERLRWQTLRRAMHAARDEARELPDGYSVRFRPTRRCSFRLLNGSPLSAAAARSSDSAWTGHKAKPRGCA